MSNDPCRRIGHDRGDDQDHCVRCKRRVMPAIKQAATKNFTISTSEHGPVEIKSNNNSGYGSYPVAIDKAETRALIAILRAAIDFDE